MKKLCVIEQEQLKAMMSRFGGWMELIEVIERKFIPTVIKKDPVEQKSICEITRGKECQS